MTELAIPLDFATPDLARDFVKKIPGRQVILKVGLELFLSGGRSLVNEFLQSGYKIFLDLKFHDIPNTVGMAVKQASEMGVHFCTVHLAGGAEMLKQAQKNAGKTTLLGVSVLTSTSQVEWNQIGRAVGGGENDIESSVLALTKLGSDVGLKGLVCSAMELDSVRPKFPSLYIMTPGIRPEGSSQDDQARVVTPKVARQKGASGIVVGRPITQASDPAKMVDLILKDLS